MSSNTNALLAFLLGTAVGGIAALLLAPEKGEVTRERIRARTAELYSQGRESLDRAKGAVQEATHEAREKARQKMDQVSASAKHQVDAVKEAVAEGRQAYRRELEKG